MPVKLRRFVLALALLAPAACGDDEGKPAGVGTRDSDGGGDASVEAGIDSSVEPVPDPPKVDPSDAGHDAAPPPPPVHRPDAAPERTCADVDCSTLTDECNVGICVEDTLECVAMPLPNGTECGSQVRDLCTAPDTCMAGTCVGNHQPAGRPCGDQGVECRNDDACDGNGNCVDNGIWEVGTACGDDTDGGVCNRPDTCNAAGRCAANEATRGTSCGDQGVACHFDDECDGNGACVDGGLWGAGTACGDDGEPPLSEPCHPFAYACDSAGSCISQDAADGTPCGDADDDECNNPDSCLAGFCVPNYEARGVACGSGSDTECDNPDFCDGFGTCRPGYEPIGTACGTPQSNPCVIADACDGAGACVVGGLVANGTHCSAVDTTCDPADTCQNGVCRMNRAAAGTSCGDINVACRYTDQCDGNGECIDNGTWTAGTSCGDAANRGVCDRPDSCDSAGTCLPNLAPAGTVCGDANTTCAAPDTCDGAGYCQDNGLMTGCLGDVTGHVLDEFGAPAAGVAVSTLGTSSPDATTSAADGSFTLQAPIGEPFLIHAAGTASSWGTVEERLVTSSFDVGDLVLTGDSVLSDIFNSVSGHAPLDTGTGIVVFSFSGVSGMGGESGSQTAASATPETPIASDTNGDWMSSQTLLPDGDTLLLFGNTAVGTTTVSASGAASINTCTLHTPTLADRQVVAHALTWVRVDCSPL